MKKLLSIILTVTILLSVFVDFAATASAKTKKSLYKAPARAALAGVDEYGESSGFLYDFNKDGVKELVMTYTKEASVPVYYAVYTIKKGKAKKLCKDKILTDFGGNCFRGVGVAKKGGKRYLVTFEDNGSGDVDYNTHRNVKVNYFKITKSKMKKVKSASFSGSFNNVANPVKVKKKVCKISGKKVSYKKYAKFIKSYSYSKVKKKYDSYWKYQTLRTKGVKSLNSLYNTL